MKSTKKKSRAARRAEASKPAKTASRAKTSSRAVAKAPESAQKPGAPKGARGAHRKAAALERAHGQASGGTSRAVRGKAAEASSKAAHGKTTGSVTTPARGKPPAASPQGVSRKTPRSARQSARDAKLGASPKVTRGKGFEASSHAVRGKAPATAHEAAHGKKIDASPRGAHGKAPPGAPPRDKPSAAARKAVEPTSVAQLLQMAGRPLTLDELIAQAGAKSTSARRRLQQALEEQLHSGAIIRNRRDEFCLRERLSLTVGVVSAHKDGHGFLQPDDGSAPVFLAPRQMLETMHGDRAAVRINGTDHRGRPQGSLVEVLERNTTEIVGRLYDESGICFVVPDNPRIGHRILIPRDRLAGARAGQVVMVKLIEQPSRTAQPLGHVSRVLGEHAAPGMETQIAIHSHGLPFEFSAQALAQAAAFGKTVPAAARRGREDLREVPLVTIDGEDARDFDDAVYCEKLRGGGWRLLVAIADVSSYVAPDTPLDEQAQLRGTSVYFPNQVLPMLPEALSNGLCSLNPQVDRLCLVCEMRINAQGKVTRSTFFEAVMRSAARLTYTKVAAYLANPQAGHDADVRDRGEQLLQLHALFKALHQARIHRGALDFDAPELKIHFDAQGRIAAFVEASRNDAHRLIEECMIAANVQAARFLKRHRIPTLYRVHGSPEEERLENLRRFLGGFGMQLPTDRDIEPTDLSEVLARSAGHEEAHLIQTVVVRTMPQAVYQPQNIGHFGLALEEYAHFTSPIRRYPDLLVHRGIRHVLHGGTAKDFPWSTAQMATLGQQCSHAERRADDATRDAMSWLKCEYMSDKLGEEFDALVTGVVDFGLFVQVKGMQVDGLVHVSALGADYFSRDASGFRIVGARSGRTFRLGDHLRVRLINVIVDERKIDFELAEGAAPQRARAPWQRNARRGRVKDRR